MEEKYFVLFMWALGVIVALCGVVGSVFQLYIISKFNSLCDRTAKNEGDIKDLRAADIQFVRDCENKREKLKHDIMDEIGY